MNRHSLSYKVVHGGFLITLVRMVSRVLGVIKLIIIGRILSPDDFGLMGIALLTMSALEVFTQTGFRSALIQKKKDVHAYLDVAWTFLILRGLFLFVSLYFIAPFIAHFFQTPQVVPIIRLLSLALIIQSFDNVGIIFFQRDLDLQKVFIYQVGGSLSSFLVTVSLALVYRNVWALVFGSLAERIVILILSYLLHPYRPGMNFDVKKAISLFSFGKWILGSSILSFIGKHIDDVLVGHYLNATLLGFYQMGFRISSFLETEFSKITTHVLFPAFARIQENQERLNKAYFRILRLVSALVIPMTAGIFLLTEDFTIIFLGSKWLPMVPIMKILAIAGFFKSAVLTGEPLFNGVGRPQYNFYLSLTEGMIIMIFIYPLIKMYGILGAAVSVLLSMLGMFFHWYLLIRAVTSSEHNQYLICFVPPVISSLVLSGFIILLKMVWQFRSHGSLGMEIISFTVFVLLCLLVYISMIFLMKKIFPAYSLIDDVILLWKSSGYRTKEK